MTTGKKSHPLLRWVWVISIIVGSTTVLSSGFAVLKWTADVHSAEEATVAHEEIRMKHDVDIDSVLGKMETEHKDMRRELKESVQEQRKVQEITNQRLWQILREVKK